MATGFEDLGAIPVESQPAVSNDFSDLGAIPVNIDSRPKSQIRRFSANPSFNSNEGSLNQFITQQRAGPVDKLGNQLKSLLENFVYTPGRAIAGTAEGLQRVAQEGFNEKQDPLTAALGGPFQNPVVQNIGQNVLEAGARGAFDLGNSIDELLKHPDQLVKLLTQFNPLVQASSFLPHTPNAEEINQFIADQAKAKQVQAVKSQPLLPEVIGKTDIPLANNLQVVGEQVLPLAIPAIRGAPGTFSKVKNSIASAVENRGILKQPLSAATTEAFGITPVEGAQDIVPVVKSSVIEANGGKLPSGPITHQTLKDAADFKIKQYVDGLKVADEQGLRHSVASLEDAMRTHLEQIYPTYSEEQINSIIETTKQGHGKLFAKDYILPTEGQQAAREINLEVNNKNPNRQVKTNEQLNAETALSQELSRQGKEVYQAATGTLGTPNQDWGLLTQAQEGLTGELKSAQRSDAGKNVAGGQKIPTTLGGLTAKGAKKIGGRVLIPTNSENVLNSLNRTLTEGKARPHPGAIDPDYQQAIIDQYTPKTAPNISVSELPTPTLEQQIQAVMKRLPSQFRTRDMAEKLIQQNAVPPEL